MFRERHQFKPGDKIRLKPDPRLVHLFDEATGQRSEDAKGRNDHDHVQSPHSDARRHRGRRGRRAAGPALLDWAKAWAQAAPWKPEKGAQISLMRWRYFVKPEDQAFVKLIDAFKQATGVDVDITSESYEDIQPKASVVANTGAGPDLLWGLYSLPHLFPQKCMD